MKTWTEVLKKNNIEFEKTKINVEKYNLEKETCELEEEDYNIKNIDEEFHKIYSAALVDLKLEFREYIEDEGLPFLNIYNNTSEYNFNDFIKYNSSNYLKLNMKIEKENEEYLNEKIEEENEIMEEYQNEMD
jgi:hypothetical protein